jgi:hypothetical protein
MAFHVPPAVREIESLDEAANLVESARFISAAFTHDDCTPFVYREFVDLLCVCDYLLDDVIGKGGGKDIGKGKGGGNIKGNSKNKNVAGNGTGKGAGEGKNTA